MDVKDRKIIAELLLNFGADINKQNYHKLTPLFEAVEYNSQEVLEFLVISGADINKEEKNGFSPL